VISGRILKKVVFGKKIERKSIPPNLKNKTLKTSKRWLKRVIETERKKKRDIRLNNGDC